MSESLFDSDKDRGKGVDQLRTKGDKLKLDWSWGTFNKGKPCQTSSVDIGDFELKVIYWHDTYEAELTYMGESLISEGHLEEDDKITTRIDGQKIAEGLLRKHYQYIREVLNQFKL